MQTFFLFEKWSQTTRKGSNELRGTDGYMALNWVKGESKAEALKEWLLLHCNTYYVHDKENGKIACDASDRVVWEPGDTSADFGDYSVEIYTESEVWNDPNLLKAARKSHNMADHFEEETPEEETPEQPGPPTVVEFYRESEENGGGVLACFPEIPERTVAFSCYSRIGQHSSYHPDYLKKCTRITNPEEYRDLKEELESIGYVLEIRQTDEG